MPRIKIKGKGYEIPSISKLSFNDFNRVIVKGEATDLKTYLAIYTDIPLDDLMNSEFSGASLSSLHQMIFDINIEEAIKMNRKTVLIEGEHRAVDDLEHNTFGKNYYFDLYHGLLRQKKLNYYELCLYALAVSVTKELDTDVIKETYKDLGKQQWTKVLPQGFFLARRLCASRMTSTRLSILFTLQLKTTKWKIQRSRKRLAKQERM